MMHSFAATFCPGLCFVSALIVAHLGALNQPPSQGVLMSCTDQDAEHGLLGNPNQIDGMVVALEIILLWINREAQNKHFKDFIYAF